MLLERVCGVFVCDVLGEDCVCVTSRHFVPRRFRDDNVHSRIRNVLFGARRANGKRVQRGSGPAKRREKRASQHTVSFINRGRCPKPVTVQRRRRRLFKLDTTTRETSRITRQSIRVAIRRWSASGVSNGEWKKKMKKKNVIINNSYRLFAMNNRNGPIKPYNKYEYLYANTTRLLRAFSPRSAILSEAVRAEIKPAAKSPTTSDGSW